MSNPNPNTLLIKATLLLASTLTVMAGATISPSLPAMQAHFSDVQNVEFLVRLVLTIPALLVVVSSPVAGQFVDNIGRKPLLIAATILYGVAGVSGFFLNSLFLILAGRALLGVAVAGVMVSATTLIADYYSGDERANFMGLQGAFTGFGGVLFLSLGGFLADQSWRWPFLIYASSLLLLPTIVGALFEPQRSSSEESLDKQREEKASLPVKLLTLIYGAGLIAQIAFYLIPVQLPFFLESLTGASASRSGLAIAFSTLFTAIASIGYGKVKQKLSFIQILGLSFSLMGIGYMGLSFASSYWWVLGTLVPAGLGLGLMIPNLNVWTSAEVGEAMRGRALGGVTTFTFLGQFLSPIVSQPVNAQLGLATTYGLSGVVLLVLGAIAWFSRRQVCKLVEASAGHS